MIFILQNWNVYNDFHLFWVEHIYVCFHVLLSSIAHFNLKLCCGILDSYISFWKRNSRFEYIGKIIITITRLIYDVFVLSDNVAGRGLKVEYSLLFRGSCEGGIETKKTQLIERRKCYRNGIWILRVISILSVYVSIRTVVGRILSIAIAIMHMGRRQGVGLESDGLLVCRLFIFCSRQLLN